MKYSIDRQGDTLTISYPVSADFAGTAIIQKTFEHVFEGLPRGTMEMKSDTKFVFTSLDIELLGQLLDLPQRERTYEGVESAIKTLQRYEAWWRSCEQDRAQDVRRGKVAGLSAARDFIRQKAKVVRADIAQRTEDGARCAQLLAQIHLDLLETIATELQEKIDAPPR